MTHPVPGSIAPALEPGTLLPEIGEPRGLAATSAACLPPRRAELRASWEYLCLIGDFEAAMRRRTLRRAVNAAACLMRERTSRLPMALPSPRIVTEACR
ncbi:hypothetical protein [Burkholderia sp. 3C]